MPLTNSPTHLLTHLLTNTCTHAHTHMHARTHAHMQVPRGMVNDAKKPHCSGIAGGWPLTARFVR